MIYVTIATSDHSLSFGLLSIEFSLSIRQCSDDLNISNCIESLTVELASKFKEIRRLDNLMNSAQTIDFLPFLRSPEQG